LLLGELLSLLQPLHWAVDSAASLPYSLVGVLARLSTLLKGAQATKLFAGQLASAASPLLALLQRLSAHRR